MKNRNERRFTFQITIELGKSKQPKFGMIEILLYFRSTTKRAISVSSVSEPVNVTRTDFIGDSIVEKYR